MKGVRQIYSRPSISGIAKHLNKQDRRNSPHVYIKVCRKLIAPTR